MARLSLALFPHKGIRNMFSKFLVLAGNTDYSNPEKVSHLFDEGRFFFDMLTAHSVDENSVVLADLELKVPGSSAHDMADHEEIESEQSKLEFALDEIYKISQEGGNPSEKGFKFYLELSKFQSHYNLHMLGEETETQKLLWDNFTDDELVGMRSRIIARMKPEFLLRWCGYMIPALSPAERNLIITGIKANSPVDLFNSIMNVAEKNLAHEDYAMLQHIK